jgi:hypothetical protein
MAKKSATRKKPTSKKSKKLKKLKKATRNKPAKGKAKNQKSAKKSKPRRVRGRASDGTLVAYEQRGLGARSGGQSGDTQGLPASAGVDSESVEELMEEGQSFEAEVMNGIERAPDPDEGEVQTEEVPEDDVPEEYREKE